MNRTMDTQTRSIVKAISYRFLASACASLIFFVLSGRVALSLGAGIIDMVLKLGLYYLHERAWERISFGREREPGYEI